MHPKTEAKLCDMYNRDNGVNVFEMFVDNLAIFSVKYSYI